MMLLALQEIVDVSHHRIQAAIAVLLTLGAAHGCVSAVSRLPVAPVTAANTASLPTATLAAVVAGIPWADLQATTDAKDDLAGAGAVVTRAMQGVAIRSATAETAVGMDRISEAALAAAVPQAVMQSLDVNRDGLLQGAEVSDSWLATWPGVQPGARLREADVARLLVASEPAVPTVLSESAVPPSSGRTSTSLLDRLAMAIAKEILLPGKGSIQDTPQAHGWPVQAVRFKSHDNLDLAGWYLPAEQPTTNGLVLVHGWGVNKSFMVKYAAQLRKFNVLAYDNRYAGESQGDFSTLAVFEVQDVPMAVDVLKQKGNTHVGLIGESLGGAAVIAAGANLKGSVDAVWNDCAFDSFYDAVYYRVLKRKYPFPSLVTRAGMWAVGHYTGTAVTSRDPIRFVGQLSPMPYYQVHGRGDLDTVPVNGEKLAAAAQEPKTVWWTQSAHAKSLPDNPDEYGRRLRAFFDGVFAAP